MWPDRVSNPGHRAHELDALKTMLRDPVENGACLYPGAFGSGGLKIRRENLKTKKSRQPFFSWHVAMP